MDQARDRGDIISLGGGAPSVPPPKELLEDFSSLVMDNPLRSFGYTGTRGVPQLREAIAEDAKEYGGVVFDPESEVIVTSGATEAIFNVLMCLVETGDEVIITDPTYLGYRELIELTEGRPRPIPVCVENGYQPDIEHLQNVITKKTKAIIALSPDNPTGRMLSESFVRGLVDLAVDHDFWIISDDIYKHIIFDQEHVWISKFPGARERTISVCSFSKEAGVPGLRLGYTLAPAEIIDSMEKMQQYTTLAPGSLGQFAILKFLNARMKRPYLQKAISHYRTKRDHLARLLGAKLPRAKTAPPQGAFYFFVDMNRYLSKLHATDEEFAAKLLSEAGVVVIPGRFFGARGKYHVRLTFVTESDDRIEAGIERIAKYVGDP